MLFLSLLLIAASVHTYCENRPIAGAFDTLSLLVAVALFLSPSGTRVGRITKMAGLVLSVFAMAISTWFIVWATNTCRQMFDHLE
jgi:hypothetical protein